MRTGETSLGDFPITVAGTYTGDWVEDFDGILAMCAQSKFAWGSGGTSLTVYIQTRLNGSTPIDIACITYGTANENTVLNFSALTPKISQVTPTDGAMSSDSAVDGIIGDAFRVKYVVVGTYAGSSELSVRVHPR